MTKVMVWDGLDGSQYSVVSGATWGWSLVVGVILPGKRLGTCLFLLSSPQTPQDAPWHLWDANRRLLAQLALFLRGE